MFKRKSITLALTSSNKNFYIPKALDWKYLNSLTGTGYVYVILQRKYKFNLRRS